MPDITAIEVLQQMTAEAKLMSKKPPTAKHSVYENSTCVDSYVAAKAELDIAEIRYGKEAPEYSTAKDSLQAATNYLKASTIEFSLQGIGRKPFEKLKLAHPPTETQIADLKASEDLVPEWNPETFPHALMCMCSVSPKLTEDIVEYMSETWTPPEFAGLFNACLQLHYSNNTNILGKD